MKNLNHAKIIQAVEKAVQAGHEEFIYDFLKAYGKAKTTINRLKAGDTSRNLASIEGDIALSRELYYRPVNVGKI